MDNETQAPETAAEQPAPEPAAEPVQEPEVTDKHGQLGINKERHDREVNELKATIKELQGQLEEQAKTEAGREEMGKRIAELEKKLEDEAIKHRLEMAGCRNVKAARAILEDYEDDVSKLKEGEPWLFSDGKPKGATGLPPSGAPDGGEAEMQMLRKAAGLK